MNKRRMLLLLALLSAFPPLSTDMYLPAIPLLVLQWRQPLTIVNLTLVAFFFGLSRPPGNNLILEQVDRHAGAASSLLVFIYFMLGAFSMWLISLNWSDKIRLIGILGAGAGGSLLILWLCLPQALTRSAQRVPLR